MLLFTTEDLTSPSSINTFKKKSILFEKRAVLLVLLTKAVTAVFESDSLLWQVFQQRRHPLNKRRELVWVLLCKSFINVQGLFK